MTFRTPVRILLACLIAAILAACSSRPGGYYKNDGPPARVPADLARIPDAVPRIEPLASGANRPYVINGKRYVPDTSGKPYRVRGVASWYGTKFHGKPTSNGETYDMYAMTAAHPTLPLPSYVRVTRVTTGRSVVLRVNDRGPFHPGRIIDLSYAAAYTRGIHMMGSDEVIVERIMPDEIRSSRPRAAAPIITPVVTPVVAPIATPSPTPPTVIATPRTPPASAGQTYLQMGAFREPGNAHALAARLNELLATAPGAPQVSVQPPRSGLLHRVHVGPYASPQAAQDAARSLSTQTGIVPILARP